MNAAVHLSLIAEHLVRAKQTPKKPDPDVALIEAVRAVLSGSRLKSLKPAVDGALICMSGYKTRHSFTSISCHLGFSFTPRFFFRPFCIRYRPGAGK